jgi:PAS domain S-box-containing protein
MSWVTIVWSMTAAACLTLGVEHLLVWFKKRTAWASLVFSLMAASIAAMAVIELAEMRAETTTQMGTLHLWYHVPVWLGVLSVTGFARIHLRAGRPWLWWATCGLRTVSLLLNFLIGQNLNYLEVTQLRHVQFLGESVSVAKGVPNPWMLVGQLSALLFVIFVADAAITVWRRGDRRLALTTGCGMAFFVVGGSVQGVLAHWQIINTPVMVSIFYLPVVAAVGYEMTREVLRAGELAEDLQESERRFRATFEQAAVGIAHISPEGRFLRVNQRYCDIAGYSRAEMLARTFQEITHPEDRAVETVLVNQLLSGERDTCSLEKRYIRKNGEVAWVNVTAALVRDRAGQPQWFIAVGEDIGSRKQTEEKVRQLSHAMEYSPVLVVITDLRGNIVYVNRLFCEVTGYSIEESIGQNPRFLKSGESSPAMYQALWARITSGETWRGEFRNRKKNGELYWESGVISPLLDATGRATHFVGFKQDITERKRAELENEQQRNQMAHLSRIATVSELSSSLAHELNQPLAIILTNAQAAQRFLAQEPPDVAEARDILADIVSEDQRAGEVIRRLRSLLKQGQTSLLPLDVNETVKVVLHLTRSDLIWQSVMVRQSLSDNLPLVSGDHIQLQQVLLNLILNACDAMAANPPENRYLTLTTAHCEGAVRISVSDSGCGLPPDAKRIFEPFYTTKQHGLGLGLSICTSIVRAHQGRLWGETRGEAEVSNGAATARGGATFHLELPAANGGKP